MRHTRTSSESSISQAFSDYESEDTKTVNNSSHQFFVKLVRDTRSKVEQKTSEINATVQEKLPEWKSRGVLYSTKAKEASIEWSKKGKEAVDRWKKDRYEEQLSTYRPLQPSLEKQIFGIKLQDAVARTESSTVPKVFKQCIDYLNLVGIHETGIYRIPGSTLSVNKLRHEFNDDITVDFKETSPDPHVVATLLKLYLRELPESVIPLEMMKNWKEHDSNKITCARFLLTQIPIYNFHLLQMLCQHLNRVAENEKETKMSVSNLSLVFIPTLNIDRLLFQCIVEDYQQVFEALYRPAGPVNTPPPLPQRPRNLERQAHSTPQKRVIHSKTMSDTDMYISSNYQLSKTVPPKPSRAVLLSSRPPLPPSKPRSKSVSSIRSKVAFSPTSEHSLTTFNQPGHVETVGKQFESLLNNKPTL